MLNIETLITIIGYGTGIVTLLMVGVAHFSKSYRETTEQDWVKTRGGRIFGVVTGIAALIWPFIFGVIWLVLMLGRLARLVIAVALIAKFSDRLDEVPFDTKAVRK